MGNIQNNLKSRIREGVEEIFDPIRRKWVALTPEERVRQLFLQLLVSKYGYPPEYIIVEYPFTLDGGKKLRADAVMFNRDNVPITLLECKAPEVPITEEVARQAARYNGVIGAKYIILTNLKSTYCYSRASNYSPLTDIPCFEP